MNQRVPHQRWRHDFLRDTGGTGFWHETYFRRGGFEAIYDDLSSLSGPPGLARFAPTVPAQGRMFSARDRLFQPTAGPAATSNSDTTDSLLPP